MEDCLILIFGMTGDLSKRKLIPSLYNLMKDGKLGDTQVVGAGLEDKTVVEILDGAKGFVEDCDENVWKDLVARFSYTQVDVNKSEDFIKLKKLVDDVRKKSGLPDKTLAYCAVAEKIYAKLTEQLFAVKVIERALSSKDRWCRVVYEKPFGHNYASVQNLNKTILRYINEDQVYRVDHYLSKEIVENIAYIRFTNRIFEPLWNNHHIEEVQITLDESIDIEKRGSYYDAYGVLKDVVQNHVLQLVALVAMDTPTSLQGRAIQDAKSHILKSIKCVDGVLGQYKGYLDEKDVAPNSQVPTFAQLKLEIDDYRWAGVPFYVRTGKVMPEKVTKICIKFKDTHCLLTKTCPTDSNFLTISIFPTGGFELDINAKAPRARDETTPVKMDFCYDCLFEPQAPRAYEVILEDISEGETALSTRVDEIEYSWQIIDQIEAMSLSVHQYPKGSSGPLEIADFNKRNELGWK